MKDLPLPQPDDTVSQVLTRWPAAAYAFIHLKTDCVGCTLARFCSLRDVAKSYYLDVEYLIQELNRATLASIPSPIKEELER